MLVQRELLLRKITLEKGYFLSILCASFLLLLSKPGAKLARTSCRTLLDLWINKFHNK